MAHLCNALSLFEFKKLKISKSNIFSFYISPFHINIRIIGTSLVVQWLRIHQPMQGTRV